MEFSLEHIVQFRMKQPILKLHRCDKIWETLQLIRDMQDDNPTETFDVSSRNTILADEKSDSQSESNESSSLNTNESPNFSEPHIKYQPVLNNGNLALPDFQLSVKSRIRLFSCVTCGKEYRENRDLRNHSQKIHGIIIPKRGGVAKKSTVTRNTRSGKNENVKPVPNVAKSGKSGFTENEIPMQGVIQNTRSRMIETEKPLAHKIQNAKSRNSESENIYIPSNKEFAQDGSTKLAPKNNDLTPQLIKCELCDRSYKHIRKHIVDYHKIKSPDVLIKVSKQQCDSTQAITPGKLNVRVENNRKNSEQERTHNIVIEKDRTHHVIPAEQQSATDSKKRKLSIPSVPPRKKSKLEDSSPSEAISKPGNEDDRLECNICLGMYRNRKSLLKHQKKHSHRGETKQNFNTKRGRYFGSRRNTSLQNLSPNKDADDNVNNNITTEVPDPKPIETRRLRSATDTSQSPQVNQLETKKIESAENSCACGRSFRNAYILFAHKTNCKIVSDIDSRNSSDRDSGIGISITIKKKNDSYEIVSRESSDEEKPRASQNSGKRKLFVDTSEESSEDCDTEDRNENLVPESSKYSKNHSVLKLRLAEEDVDVDIEDDSQDESCKKDITHRVIEDETKVANGIIVIDKNNEILGIAKSKQEVPSLKLLCKRFFINKGLMPKAETSHKCQRCQTCYGNKENLLEHTAKHKKLIEDACICGMRFKAITAFDSHIAESHPQRITCSYCKERFANIVLLEEHICLVQQGTLSYIETSSENHSCPNCNAVFPLIKRLESHITAKHPEPALPFQCYKCMEKFPNKMMRNIHLSKKHTRNIACSVCNQKFQSEKMKYKHEAYHQGVGFPCHVCKKTYRTKGVQTKHIEGVHSDLSNDVLVCFICTKSVKTKSYKRHVLRHNNVLKCELCDKIVYDIRNLESHILSNHGEEEYPRKKCNVCGISFPTKEQLEAHINEEESGSDYCKSVVKEEVLLDS